MSNKKISLLVIKQNLDILTKELIKDLIAISKIKYSSATKSLDFEIRNDSYIYSIMGYPMDSKGNQTGTGNKLLGKFSEVGIIISSKLITDPTKINIDIEKFCNENRDKIIDLIIKWLSKAWESIVEKSFKLPDYIMIIDERRKFNLKSKKWTL